MTVDGMPKITPAAVKGMAEAIPKIIDKHPVASSIAAAVIPVPGAEEVIEARIAEESLKKGVAKFGQSATTNYKKTFFDTFPETQGKVVVHHAVEQQVKKHYPGLVSNSEMHSLKIYVAFLKKKTLIFI